jgi:Fe-S oxidoreductase
MDTPIRTGFGETSASEPRVGRTTGICPHCGQSINHSLEEFLGKLGITDEMINNLKNSMQNINVEEYLETAREYLRTGGDKAKTFAKENPGKVAAGVAVLAVGAGLLISALRRD